MSRYSTIVQRPLNSVNGVPIAPSTNITYSSSTAGGVSIFPTPVATQMAIWKTPTFLEGVADFTWIDPNLAVPGNVKATGDLVAYEAGSTVTWWDDMPFAEMEGSGAMQGGVIVGDGLTIDGNGVLTINIGDGLFINSLEELESTGGGGEAQMEWPASPGIANYAGGNAWGTSYTVTGTGSVVALSVGPTFTGTLTATGDEAFGNSTDGTNVQIIGKSGTSYSYNFNTKAGDYLKILSNKGGATAVYLDSDGNVGIGVDPSYTFHVEKTIAGDNIARINNTSATGNGLLSMTTSSTPGNYSLAAFSNGAYNFWVDAFGYVGIGTIAPDYLLTVGSDTAGATVIVSINTNENQQKGLALTSAGVTKWYMYNPASSADLRFHNGTADKMILDVNGNLTCDADIICYG